MEEQICSFETIDSLSTAFWYLASICLEYGYREGEVEGEF